MHPLLQRLLECPEQQTQYIAIRRLIGVHLGDGEGALGTPMVLPPAAPTALAVGDLNGDGVQDIATTRGPGTLSVFHGNGDGTFDAPIDFSVAGSPAGVAIGDLNEDGKADIVVTSQTTLQASILVGFMPTFYWPIVNLPTSSGPTRVRFRDLNADHHLDLVILNEDARWRGRRLRP